jgi:hypothetical protein
MDPQRLQVVQAGSERLLQPHEMVPGPELPAVGVSGQLQVKSRSGRHRRAAWLVRQQQAEHRLQGRVGQRPVGVAAVAFVEMVGTEVGHPGVDTRVVPMVAGDEEGAVGGTQLAQRFDMAGQFAQQAQDKQRREQPHQHETQHVRALALGARARPRRKNPAGSSSADSISAAHSAPGANRDRTASDEKRPLQQPGSAAASTPCEQRLLEMRDPGRTAGNTPFAELV